jgi:hypothetical protein
MFSFLFASFQSIMSTSSSKKAEIDPRYLIVRPDGKVGHDACLEDATVLRHSGSISPLCVRDHPDDGHCRYF